jgi:alkylation response protein AidB-like acyl-CoA dehydrogenase
MDFEFTEDQQELRSLARQILADRVTPSLLREVEEGQQRFDRDLWRQLGTAGLIGVSLPEAYGGGGLGFLEQCLVLEQAGRVLAPVPLLASVTAAAAIARFGSAPQRERWLPAAAAGDSVLAVALSEPASSGLADGAVATRAVRDGDQWRLTGVKTAVTSGTLAGLFVVPASTGEGTALFLVEAGQPGVTVTRQHTSNRDETARLELDCLLPADAGLGAPGGDAVAWTLDRATVALCALQLGVLEEALSATAAYTKERIAFGQPIATFQAVSHRAADSYIDVEALRLTLWQAAWRLSAELPARTEVEVAKFWAAESGHRVAHAAVHLHGGMGVAVEYPLHRYFLWAKQLEFSLGGATQQLVRLGNALAAEPA